MKCTNCQNELNEGANFCFNCGTKVEKEKFCSQCGTKLMMNANFCFNCGCAIDNAGKEETNKDITTMFDNLSKKDNAINWYKRYFEYIGDFVDGFAPVIDNISNPKTAGFVSIDIPEKLKNKEIEKFSINPQTYILLHFDINKKILNSHDIIWVGEFHEGKALVANETEIYTIDLQGNIQENGSIRNIKEFSPYKCVIVHNNGLYGSTESEHDSILDYKGNLVRDNYEFIRYSGFDNFATFVNVNTGKVGLLKISNGKLLLKANYDEIYCEYGKMPDGTNQCVMIPTIRNADNEIRYGCLNPYKGWILKPVYPSIEIIKTVENWNQGQLLVCLSHAEDEEDKTIYKMVVTDISGNTLFKYTSYDDRYIVLDEETHVFIQRKENIDIVNINNNKVLLSVPNVTYIDYLGEGYFKIKNRNGQCGVIDRYGRFSIPYGVFDEIGMGIYNGALKVSKDKLWGFADVNGNILIPLMYASIRDEYCISEYPDILVYPVTGSWFYINYKNETDGGISAEKYISDKLDV